MDTPPPEPFALEHAHLGWGEHNAPEALDYGDIYFSRESGRQETQHVFINGNDLPARFSQWQRARPFVVGESGFGSGLNMLCVARCFLDCAPERARLHLVSSERHPFSAADLARALSAQEDLADLREALIEQWPPPQVGVHRLLLHPRITLDLHFGDAAERLTQLVGRIDAWCLDGFAPAKNPQMWRPELFAALAQASRPGATFATFTCAGVVKRGLKAVGFQIGKRPGFGRKREMLCGHFAASPLAYHRAPWRFGAVHRAVGQDAHIVVVGAGIAGSATAHALARRGRRVTLVDAAAPGAGASGNHQGALYIRLAAERNPQSRFYLAALGWTLRWLAQLDPAQRLWQPCGVLQLAGGPREAERQRRTLAHWQLPAELVRGVDRREAEQLAGQPLADAVAGALYYPTAGWVRPARLCERLADTPGVTFRRAAVTRIGHDDAERPLVTLDGSESLSADRVVVACAGGAAALFDDAFLPLQAVRGQVSHFRLNDSSMALSPRCVVCAGGYVPPALDGVQSLGASFVPNDADSGLRAAEDSANRAELARALPALDEALESCKPLASRSAVRCASPDKSPWVGPLPAANAWRHDYAALAFDATRMPFRHGRYLPGVWVNLAHGSRGLVSAPLSAELIASQLCDEALPLEDELVEHLHPGRRLIRAMIRRTL
ncbi:bifunctional tRNA (5-methylaminomethyl-2-thiouridine)(34)-methyltransferase MnmD/FAD-dependent 5-carboxymethylaminomethyl-2-thiouridine(34) oxidoreductase MnmC [Kushneria aurantia]|uniref:tRNA 5-methylaminomethyl-2-thiouridine biosynthesis bifunctional protein MnmC n=1 Tax=Kushneria aurantia TaxID=504092 RepID=A0ABV6G3Q7_9GAMM|nr:bifunctional tRNA (5-methylaminomethyl-2-thiouridine)(34)-methyltransferase MnmD/FAD-dependent 5-carboxymethylaminomethyl-2-thiouridine(34) oxidoreductase MnmC [Kushneria aurantia]